MSPSRWLRWTPGSPIIEKSPEPGLTKLTNPNFVSSVSPLVDPFPIIDPVGEPQPQEDLDPAWGDPRQSPGKPAAHSPLTEAPIIRKTPHPALPKPTKPKSVGFVSPRIAAFPIIETTKPTANQAVEGDSFRYKIAPVPPRPAAPGICPDTSTERTSHTAPSGKQVWPREYLQAADRFARPYARLFPLVGKKVSTPSGTGTLEQVLGPTLVRVALDSNPARMSTFGWEQILPLLV